MATVIRCDSCRRYGDDGDKGWLRVEHDAAVQWLERDYRTKHFCCWQCLAVYATVQRQSHATNPPAHTS